MLLEVPEDFLNKIDALMNAALNLTVSVPHKMTENAKHAENAVQIMRSSLHNCKFPSNTNEHFKVERDMYGFAKAISYKGYYVLHLDIGTKRNEEFVDRIVKVLNNVSIL